jgi:hypothetical protein
MQRPWGELVSMDLKTRTGTFRKEGSDEIVPFIVLPYAELLHHAAFGDLDDFRIGERAIFRLHQNDEGKWIWLTYIQDQMNMMNGHKEYFFVDKIDPEKHELEVTQANKTVEPNFIREKGIHLETDAQTRYWKEGKPAQFSDIHMGDALRTKTHGIGKGKHQVCWEVFLDDASLKKFQDEQKAAHAQRMIAEGAPGYVDEAAGQTLKLTLFQESGEVAHQLKAGDVVSLAPAGVDRIPTAKAVTGKVASVNFVGPVSKVALTLDAPATEFAPKQIARLWRAVAR